MNHGKMVHLQGLAGTKPSYINPNKFRKEKRQMVGKVLSRTKRFALLGLVAGLLAFGFGVALDTVLGGADSAQAGIDTSPGMPGR
jgi:hypothetical protein